MYYLFLFFLFMDLFARFTPMKTIILFALGSTFRGCDLFDDIDLLFSLSMF